MKTAVAIVQPHQLDALRDALLAIGLRGLTVTEVKRLGAEPGYDFSYRGVNAAAPAVPRLQVEVCLGDASLAQVMEVIEGVSGSRSGGRVFVRDLFDARRIRTGDAREQALE